MESLTNYLQTPSGAEMMHAIAILITAIAAYLGYLAHSRASDAAEKIDGHMFLHRQEDYRTAVENMNEQQNKGSNLTP